MPTVPHFSIDRDPPHTGGQGPNDLLQSLLAESRELTAAERFAVAHETGKAPAQAKHYRDLIPLAAPAAGQQYAFDVDLDLCSGCKACVSACHHLNGLETTETWRSVGLLRGQHGLPVLQHITTACHHCVEPGCLHGCPTNAYEKDPTTGIVRHLDDQCFGCQYCTMACPYEVPQYSPSKGIVRKCDMCHGRLAAGEAPACVQACPHQAIRISVVDVEQTVAQTTSTTWLPDAPPAHLTHPTTVYRKSKKLPADLQAADSDYAAPQHAHWPLVIMLVLTQLSVGALAIGILARWLDLAAGVPATMVLGTLAGLAGLGVAPLHLGRPHLAFRSVLGWRHSWLSREAIIFGLYAPLAILATTYALLPLWESRLASLNITLITNFLSLPIRVPVELAAMLAGAGGVYCSAKIYQFTGREFWLGQRTLTKFGGTAIVLGLAFGWACVATSAAVREIPVPNAPLAMLLLITASGKLAYEAAVLRHRSKPTGSLRWTAQLMRTSLRTLTVTRFALGAAGGILVPLGTFALPANSWPVAVLAIVGFVATLVGELAERTLFFRAVVPLRMPGGVRS